MYNMTQKCHWEGYDDQYSGRICTSVGANVNVRDKRLVLD
jgi:hypothetical protein